MLFSALRITLWTYGQDVDPFSFYRPWCLALTAPIGSIAIQTLSIFMLCANYRGIGIPILWKVLSKKGNSSTTECTELLCLFIGLFGIGRINHFAG